MTEMAARTGCASISMVTRLRLQVVPKDYYDNNHVDKMGMGRSPPPPTTSRRRNPSSSSSPYLSLTKPSWIVRTESHVRKEIRKKPDPPCVVCRGTGRVDCQFCSGQGRTNCVHVPMLPRGEWPKWCRTCGGSGLSYCSRCLGTGEYRYIMGFHFMNTGTTHHLDAQPPTAPSDQPS